MNTAASRGLMPQHGWDATALQDGIAPLRFLGRADILLFLRG